MSPSSDAPLDAGAEPALRFATALSALNGVPSWNVTSLRSCIVSCVLSEFHFHDVASIGTNPVPGAGSSWINRSYELTYNCQPLRPPEYVCGFTKLCAPDAPPYVMVAFESGTCFAAAEAGAAVTA